VDFVIVLGFLAAFLTTGALLPQAIKAWKTKSTGDLSLRMFSMIFTGTICWLIYGILTSDPPIIFANSIALIITSVILYHKIAHTHRDMKKTKINNQT